MGSLQNNAFGLQAAVRLAFIEQVPHATIQVKAPVILQTGKTEVQRGEVTFPEFHRELEPEPGQVSGHQGQCAMGKGALSLT